MRMRSTLAVAVAALVAALAAGCGAGTKPEVVPGASVSQGHDLIAHYGCGACHQIGAVRRSSSYSARGTRCDIMSGSLTSKPSGSCGPATRASKF